MLDASTWDPRDPSFRADPYPWYRELRERAPVHLHPEVGYVISRYADVEALLRDTRFSVSTPSPWRELLAEHAVPQLRMLGESTLGRLGAARGRNWSRRRVVAIRIRRRRRHHRDLPAHAMG